MRFCVNGWQCSATVTGVFVAQKNELLQFVGRSEIIGIGDDGEEMLVENFQHFNQGHRGQLDCGVDLS